MGKAKHNRVNLDEILERPWCYYCERDFDDVKVLLSHQKAKHFKCDNCSRRLNTAGGLSVHLQQVHKETLTKVDNAIEGREGVEPEIFGMMGIPDELVKAHEQRTRNEFYRVEAERRALTGNPPPGRANGEPNSKKRKIETPEELKARLAEHRARRAAEKQAEKEGRTAQSASITPDPAQAHPAPMHQFPNLPTPTGASAPPGAPAAFPYPNQPPPSFSPPGQGPWAPPQFSPFPPKYSPMPGQMPGATPPGPPGPPFGTPYAPLGPPRQNGLPTAPGLPDRPAFEMPSFNRQDMQRMHSGQALPARPQVEAPQSDLPGHASELPTSLESKSQPKPLEEAGDAEAAQPAAEKDSGEKPVKKPGKKKGNLPTKRFFSDDNESPEEKMAAWSKFAFFRSNTTELVEGEVSGAVTGVTVDEDTVLDPQN